MSYDICFLKRHFSLVVSSDASETPVANGELFILILPRRTLVGFNILQLRDIDILYNQRTEHTNCVYYWVKRVKHITAAPHKGKWKTRSFTFRKFLNFILHSEPSVLCSVFTLHYFLFILDCLDFLLACFRLLFCFRYNIFHQSTKNNLTRF